MGPKDLQILALRRKKAARRRAFVKARESREAQARAFQERMERVARGLPANHPRAHQEGKEDL